MTTVGLIDIDNQGSGALLYLRTDLFPRPEIHSYIPPHWVQESIRWNDLNISPLIVLTSKVRYLSLREQQILHSALRRTAKLVYKSAPLQGQGRRLET